MVMIMRRWIPSERNFRNWKNELNSWIRHEARGLVLLGLDELKLI